jgi:hypothetical protein
LRACVLTYGKNWEDSLAFVEFSYNNGYHTSLKKAPFEVLYGRKCRTPLMWSEVGDRVIENSDFIKAIEEKIAEVRENLRIARSRQKSYADRRRRELKFDVGDHIYLKVSPICGTRRFRVHGKLAPRYIGPYPHHQKDWRCGIKDKAAKVIIRRAQRLSCVPTLKVSPSARRPSGARHLGPTRRSVISRSTHENLGHHDSKNPDASL